MDDERRHVDPREVVPYVDFTVPEGTTVTSAPESCTPRTLSGGYHPQRTGAPRYVCSTPYRALSDTVRAFPFKLRVDRVVPGAAGRVFLSHEGPDSTDFTFDPNSGNNKAKVVVNAVPAA